jgi:membrane fusion protein, heavy metal efflux system
VELGAQNDRSVEVLKGLLPGDEVVTRGAYALAFAGKGSVSLKEALDAAHGHPHNEDGSEMSKEQAAAARGAGAHEHGGGRHWNTLTIFFAGTTGLLLVLLIVAMAGRRQPQGTQ